MLSVAKLINSVISEPFRNVCEISIVFNIPDDNVKNTLHLFQIPWYDTD